MTFFAIGLNHLRAPVHVRERFAFDQGAARRLLGALALSPGAEVVLLSTCNRTEAYGYGLEADVAEVKRVLCAHAGRAWPDDLAFEARSEAAVRHLLQVTAGLRSLVLGDAQIFSQVKEAYRIAVEEDRVGTAMHRLMHAAFHTAKRIVNETALTSGAASVPRVAVAAARAHVERQGHAGLAECAILVVGAGEMGRQTIEALSDAERARVTVTNRSAERAHALAGVFGLPVVPWADRHAAAGDADVVVVATGADEPVLLAGPLAALPPREGGRLLVDISVPRNVDRRADALPGLTVLDLDTLNLWLVQTEQARRDALPAAERICEEVVADFMTWAFHHRAMQPAIQAVSDTFERIRQQEVERHHHRLSGLDRDELDRLTQSIVQKILAVPVVRLKGVDPASLDYVHGIRLLHALFARPDCEDVAAVEHHAHEALRAILDVQPRPSAAPEARCPFATDGGVAPCVRADEAPHDAPAARFVRGATG